jgi:hypothetical protein
MNTPNCSTEPFEDRGHLQRDPNRKYLSIPLSGFIKRGPNLREKRHFYVSKLPANHIKSIMLINTSIQHHFDRE